MAGLLLLVQEDPHLLIEKLRSDKVEERQRALFKLRELGDQATAELEKATRDSDAEVAGRAKQLLRYIAVRGNITAALRKAAPTIDDLLFMGNDAACTEILLSNYPIGGRKPRNPELGAADLDVLAPAAVRGAVGPDARWEICLALRFWGLKSGARELVAYLSEPRGREEAIRTLGEIGNKDCAAPLVPYLIDPEYRVRDIAGEALVKLGSQDLVLHRSIELLKHDDDQVRSQAAYRLGALGAATAIPALTESLKDANADVRRAAVQALTRLGARDRVPQMLQLMRGPSGPGQRDAAEGIAWLDSREAIPDLIAMLRDPDRSAAGEAAHALGKLQAREAIEPLSRLVVGKDRWLREKSIEALGLIGDPACISEVLQGLGDRDGYVVVTTLHALWHLQATQAAPRIVPLLNFRDTDNAALTVRGQAAILLGRFGAVGAVPKLLPLLKDEHLRSAAIEALGLLQATDAVPDLEKLASGEKPDAEAILALARMGRKSAVAPLLKAKEPADWPERGRRGRSPEDEMMFAMNRFGNPEAYQKLAALKVRRMDNRANRKSPRDVIREMEKTHGLKVEFDKSLDAERLDKVWEWPLCWLSVTSLPEVLQKESGGEILLDGDRVILVSPNKAYAHWKEWWAADQKK